MFQVQASLFMEDVNGGGVVKIMCLRASFRSMAIPIPITRIPPLSCITYYVDILAKVDLQPLH